MSQTASWTCFILLPPSWHFGTKAEVHSAGSGHGLGFPCAMYPEAPKAKKSCSSWGVGECHRQKLKHFVKRPSGPPTRKQTWPMEFSYWQLLFFSHSSVQVSLWRCSIWNDMSGHAVVPGACRVAILDTKRFGQSLNEKPDPQLQGKREWILERAPVNAGPSPWTALGRCGGQHVLCAFGTAAAKRICGVLTQVMFICCFSSSLTLGMPVATSRRPFWGLEPVDTRSLRSARRRISDLCYASRGCQGSPHLLSCIPPKASLRSDILEARHHVRSFNLLGKLLNKAQKQSEPLTRSDAASKLGLATTKSYGPMARVTWSQSVWWTKKSCPSEFVN